MLCHASSEAGSSAKALPALGNDNICLKVIALFIKGAILPNRKILNETGED